ncbi:MAG: primosomal protein N' [Eubacteriales bacterium]
MAYPTAGVHILSLPYFADRLFEYYIPAELSDSVKPGSLVVVPFGGANKRMNAVVFAFSERDQISELKPIESVNSEVSLSEEERRLCLFMKEHLFCSVSDAVKQMLPTEALTKLSVVYKALPHGEELTPVSKNALIVYADVLQAGELSAERLVARYGEGTDKILQKLCEYGYLEKVTRLKEGGNRIMEEIVHLNIPEDRFDEVFDTIRGSKQALLISHLRENGSSSFDILKDRLAVTRKQLETLSKKGLITVEKRDSYRNPYQMKQDRSKTIELSPAQRQAYDKIAELLDSGEPKAALLHGITGSGKTMVIKAAIDKVISEGKQAILLVPEIALTPQAVSVFCTFYGERVAVLHSSLSKGERFDAWRKIRSGAVDLCIGTRSAVFAPFSNLGLIVIDEEHEHTYKSDQTPRYHARDIARFRCAYHKATMLLASATPSVESYYKAETGVYTLIELTERYGTAKLPETVICDLRLDAGQGRMSSVGSVLSDALSKTLDKGEQGILFVNRRGFNNYLSCPLCGAVVTCPHCSVSLTYHAKSRNDKCGYLACHYCGYRQPIPEKCPECGSDQFHYMGFGTQKAEDDLHSEFPDARLMRMDADTACAKFSVDRMLESFRNKEADILIGTQMVTKGHNFPDVTLVGVLLADTSLYLSDYRAGERTFALITQVIGRAGRGEKNGIAVIQTYSPDHPVLLLAAAQNYKEFYQNEIAARKALLYPPFCDIALISLASPDEGLLSNVALSFTNRIKELSETTYKGVQIIVFGPFEAPVYKLNESFRMRFVVKCRSNQKTRQLFAALMDEYTKKAGKKITISIDLNPSSL